MRVTLPIPTRKLVFTVFGELPIGALFTPLRYNDKVNPKDHDVCWAGARMRKTSDDFARREDFTRPEMLLYRRSELVFSFESTDDDPGKLDRESTFDAVSGKRREAGFELGSFAALLLSLDLDALVTFRENAMAFLSITPDMVTRAVAAEIDRRNRIGVRD